MKVTWVKPRYFFEVSKVLFPIFIGLGVFFFAVGLYTALLTSPPDYQQGDAMRIMYVHVPASWMALFAYALLAFLSFFVLVWRSPLAELLAVSIAPIGALFTVLSLVTGSLWGKPMWGAYWVWDARLTSVLVLLFLYSGYWALYKAYTHTDQGIRAASLLALVGVINLPIIKWSVNWWNTLHQPASLTKLSAPSIHPSMLLPLGLMTAAYIFYFFILLILRARTELNKRKLLIQESLT
ncbi:MAG: heme exporter membrane protein [uncultured bacterium]|nr:MAG: heme exporter membrane protein [uncultured bacterium]OFW68114.1 MAG: heme transporter HemC [Alphaproteobacteria bacterium GWC2_42_16]OFW73505.1 MAG: heme transporter HemC [Alphaproteobacteria bacterium GWA2_41_27]OFW82354.1 MAG: heme transporter HemC [Alphaproteobacteria bacterium RIFCSPHIGHO2_12_FULL_42_100]OFW86180.1 MAG: heme transporter HemC [Alphaproteobacteria bacterium RBG_16_42_14]OFW91740.1 MAG: heme transporter HemC [Alphaproteobacteria bacterium RIFCSPHIGHO2_02_FULL_42_30]O